MAPGILERVFDPFFTTKEVGEGSGLGLSMVYGFAQQSSGHVKIDSKVGAGTTAKLYLPRAQIDEAGEDIVVEAEENLPRGHGEVILVLEDDPEVRTLAVGLLNDLGYTVFEAADAQAAETTLTRVGRVDVVLSDIVLPGGVSGPDFAEKTVRQNPGTRVLYMSGYTADAAEKNGFLDDGATLLNKPFLRSELAEAVQNVLRA
jgi:CheY-like chemotaxis protein